MKISVINMGVHPDKDCSCGRPGHIGLADKNPVGGGGYRYHDHICSQCALTLIADLSRNVRTERGTSKDELKETNAKIGTREDLLEKSYNVLTWLMQPAQPVAQLMNSYHRENINHLISRIKHEAQIDDDTAGS